MPKAWERLRTSLEWLEHGKTVAELISSLAAGTVLRAVLHVFTTLPGVWITPIWLTFAAALFSLLYWWGRKRKATQKQGQQAAPNALVSSPATFDANHYLKHSYPSGLQQETEQNIRTMVAQTNPTDREAFYVKFIATGVISYVCDQIWAYIYQSQVKMLLELNRNNGLLPLVKAKSFYDNAVAQYPQRYASYTFPEWLDYMKSNQLLLLHPSDMVEITFKGKDFLRYLAHWGRYPEDRQL